MLYNWIDMEAATTGIRADRYLNDPVMASLLETLEALEPGYAASRDKHSSFVADISGVATKPSQQAATAKVNAAAAYLAAKKQKEEKKVN